MDTGYHQLLTRVEQQERHRRAAEHALAVRLVRLRRLDRRAQRALARARLARQALT